MKTAFLALISFIFVLPVAHAETVTPCVYVLEKIISTSNELNKKIDSKDATIIKEIGEKMEAINEALLAFEDSRTAGMEGALDQMASDADYLLSFINIQLLAEKRSHEQFIHNNLSSLKLDLIKKENKRKAGIASFENPSIEASRNVQTSALLLTYEASQEKIRRVNVMLISAATELIEMRVRINKLRGITNPHYRGKDDANLLPN